jgi:hypothetical protein
LVVGKHVPQLSFLDIMLGTEQVFEPKERIFQRLLAGDQEQAAELFEESLQDKPAVAVYDTVLLPALALAETHWQLGELNEGQHTFILQSLKEMIQDQGERQRETQLQIYTPNASVADDDSDSAAKGPVSGLSILCLPARSEADEIASLMAAQVFEATGRVVDTVGVAFLTGELVELVDGQTADVICISATPPAAVMHARYLCKRLRARLPTVKLVVGLWDAQGDLTKAAERIGCGATVVSTLSAAQEQISLLTPSPLPPPHHDHFTTPLERNLNNGVSVRLHPAHAE